MSKRGPDLFLALTVLALSVWVGLWVRFLLEAL